MVLMATWEAQFSASQFAILNGGRAGAIWVYLGAFFGFLTAIASMAEMSSMSPTTGGQYRKPLRFYLGLASADKRSIVPEC
jgi:choline transport protein